jgi:hypothetical protein
VVPRVVSSVAVLGLVSLVSLAACGSDGGGASSQGSGVDASTYGADAAAQPGADAGDAVVFGQVYTGGLYHLGPVDYAESAFHNACAPGTKYSSAAQQAEGTLLVGLWDGIPNVEGYCDACIKVRTDKGKSAVLRVVTYGDTTPNSIDVSPEAYQLLFSGEDPRTMSWQLAKCPPTGAVMYEFQTGSSEWWTSLWVRNARVPVAKIEVKSANHPQYVAMQRGSDGTLTDGAGFGVGPFSIRITGIDGSTVEDSFPWPAGGIAGANLTGAGNFP